MNNSDATGNDNSFNLENLFDSTSEGLPQSTNAADSTPRRPSRGVKLKDRATQSKAESLSSIVLSGGGH